MKTTRFHFMRLIICTVFAGGNIASAQAQKTDEIQLNAVWAPTVKVDGTPAEWPMPLKATNKKTGISYTMANDNGNLYVIIQSSEAADISKIMMGGVSLTINPDGKKKVKDGYTVTFPVVSRPAMGSPDAQSTRGQRGSTGQSRQINQQQRDSLRVVQYKTQLAALKEIKVQGFKNITDSLISIFNEYGIKAFAAVADDGVFTCEFAIPLKAIQLSADLPKEFSYNIKVNGMQLPDVNGGNPRGGGMGGMGGGTGGMGGGGMGGGGMRGGAGGGGMMGGAGNPGDRQAMMSATDLWGKYTLTKQ